MCHLGGVSASGFIMEGDGCAGEPHAEAVSALLPGRWSSWPKAVLLQPAGWPRMCMERVGIDSVCGRSKWTP